MSRLHRFMFAFGGMLDLTPRRGRRDLIRTSLSQPYTPNVGRHFESLGRYFQIAIKKVRPQ